MDITLTKQLLTLRSHSPGKVLVPWVRCLQAKGTKPPCAMGQQACFGGHPVCFDRRKAVLTWLQLRHVALFYGSGGAVDFSIDLALRPIQPYSKGCWLINF